MTAAGRVLPFHSSTTIISSLAAVLHIPAVRAATDRRPFDSRPSAEAPTIGKTRPGPDIHGARKRASQPATEDVGLETSLISLWIAEGLLMPSDCGETLGEGAMLSTSRFASILSRLQPSLQLPEAIRRPSPIEHYSRRLR